MICELELPRNPAVAVVVAGQDFPRSYVEIGLENNIVFGTKIGPDVLPDDMIEYLNARAEETGMSPWDAYCEEMEAKLELQRITPSNAALLEIAKTSGPPPGLVDEPEERP